MATQQQPINRPIPGVMFGITHEVSGELIIREPKILKVGIGMPKGPALNVWIAPDGKWKVRLGHDKDAKTATLGTRKAAEDLFNEKLAAAPVCPYPRKIGYFTFTKPAINADGKEIFVPDFDAIESQGPAPTEIDIVLLDDSPFSGAYQMWSSSELRCKGDGVNAMRLVTIAATPDEKAAAQLATEAGEKYFAIGNCWTLGCPYSKETSKNGKPQPSACKPGGDLKFQLASNIRVGGTAYFHTTGYRSISSIFSSLHRISALTGGRLSGIPLKMVLRPFKTNHNGQAATQYAVALEFRAPDVATLRQKLLETVFEYRQAAGIAGPHHPVRMIEAPAADMIEEAEDEQPIGAQSMAAEFYPEADDDEDGSAEDTPETPTAPSAPAASAPAAAATQDKSASLAGKMRQARGTTAQAQAAPAPAPVQPAAPAAQAAPTQPAQPSEDMF